MSKYAGYKTQFKDKDTLVSALVEMGYAPNVYETPVRLQGYQGDRRAETAEIIIPRVQVGASSNDVGFKRKADGTYTAIISAYDSRTNFNDEKQKQLKRTYGIRTALKICERHNLRVGSTRTRTVNGKTQIVISAYARA